ncbi:hypothetical protein UCRPC4_g06119 [Phaeomoniella chlamydospora]|uniref:Aminoglycoside phosphotransferase domain-containing protein n=1 Tax=Phaeomoniella chlamydospora TaxID=158046 RepID=A0A0G2E088_PHACM|nr:hypothetical protein UCRPC4_g06119 [Phaeomoniella chlamydospora]
MRSFVYSEAIEPLKEHLLKFPDLVPFKEARKLYQIIESNFWRPTPQIAESLVLGDCWTGAILIEPPLTTNIKLSRDRSDSGVFISSDQNTMNNKSSLKIGVIDWEFASVGRGFDGDMSQLLAHLQQFFMLAIHRGNQEVASSIESLLEGLVGSYLKVSREEQALWTHTPTPTPRFNGSREHDNITNNQAPTGTESAEAFQQQQQRQAILRSFLISHAAEIINCAFWKQWECGPECCGSRLDTQTSPETEFSTSNAPPQETTTADSHIKPTPASDPSKQSYASTSTTTSTFENTTNPPDTDAVADADLRGLAELGSSPIHNQINNHSPSSSSSSTTPFPKPPKKKKEDCKLIRNFMIYALKILNMRNNKLFYDEIGDDLEKNQMEMQFDPEEMRGVPRLLGTLFQDMRRVVGL